ncbi:MAG: hypothetical protein AAGF23_14280 [Acidobacteriota bacterium]
MPDGRPTDRFTPVACLVRGFYVAIVVMLLFINGGSSHADDAAVGQLRAHTPEGASLEPPIPSLDEYPAQLVVDDESAELNFGLLGASSRPFLWLNRFDLEGPIRLEEIWVLFPQDATLDGAEIEWVVFQDDNPDPLDGAQLYRASTGVVQAADGVTFSIYDVDPPVTVTEPHLYLGVISRYAELPTPPTTPAVLDTDSGAARAWVGVWQGLPPMPPELPADDEMFLIDNFAPGVWMIRGFGRPVEAPSVPSIPSLDQPTFLLFAIWLATAAILLLRRRRTAQGSSR